MVNGKGGIIIFVKAGFLPLAPGKHGVVEWEGSNQSI
jgi:hypothetical protein